MPPGEMTCNQESAFTTHPAHRFVPQIERDASAVLELRDAVIESNDRLTRHRGMYFRLGRSSALRTHFVHPRSSSS
jgi:hypothetical protein